MKKLILFLFLLTGKLTFGQIINGGFEVWDTIGSCTYCTDLINLFGVSNPAGGYAHAWANENYYGVKRTTDSYSGSYSLLLHNWYSYATGWINYDDTISYRPQYLQGYFKYVTTTYDGISHGVANVALTRFNGLGNDTIATGTYQFDSTLSFTPFQITLNYFSALTPDSIKIYLNNDAGTNGGCNHNVVCNLLYLDNLTLSDSPLGIENVITNENLVSVFPNPSGSELDIQNNSHQPIQFKLFNSLGEKIIDKLLTNKTNTINLSAYSNNAYFYKVSNDKQEIKSGKIIKQ